MSPIKQPPWTDETFSRISIRTLSWKVKQRDITWFLWVWTLLETGLEFWSERENVDPHPEPTSCSESRVLNATLGVCVAEICEGAGSPEDHLGWETWTSQINLTQWRQSLLKRVSATIWSSLPPIATWGPKETCTPLSFIITVSLRKRRVARVVCDTLLPKLCVLWLEWRRPDKSRTVRLNKELWLSLLYNNVVLGFRELMLCSVLLNNQSSYSWRDAARDTPEKSFT